MDEHLKKIQAELKSGESQLFDVREDAEWVAGHLLMAKLVPLSELMQGTLDADALDKDKKTYLHCRSGNRVLEAAPLLEDLGFANVEPLSAGFEQLSAQGFEWE